jgi:heterodisulfide reductase subunit C
MKIISDPSLSAIAREYSKFDTNSCLQCGSYTIVCDLSNNSASFPRKTLRYTLAGLKNQLKSRLTPGYITTVEIVLQPVPDKLNRENQ